MARRSLESLEWADWSDDDAVPDSSSNGASRPEAGARVAPVDGMEAFPDVVSSGPLSDEPPPLLPSEPDVTTGEDERLVFDAPTAGGEYRLPDRGALKASPPARGDASEVSERTARLLVETLANFGVDATIVGTIAGPRVVRYELQLAPGTKVSKVAGLKDDLSYALATTEIRILAPIPGKQAVGVEVPNLAPRMVTLGDIFDDLPAGSSPLSVWLGQTRVNAIEQALRVIAVHDRATDEVARRDPRPFAITLNATWVTLLRLPNLGALLPRHWHATALVGIPAFGGPIVSALSPLPSAMSRRVPAKRVWSLA